MDCDGGPILSKQRGLGKTSPQERESFQRQHSGHSVASESDSEDSDAPVPGPVNVERVSCIEEVPRKVARSIAKMEACIATLLVLLTVSLLSVRPSSVVIVINAPLL